MATRTTSRARASAKLEKADLLDIYRIMLLSRRIDDKEIQLKRQNKIFFQISGAGHEARAGRRGHGPPPRLRLVLPLLSRPRALPRPRHDRRPRCSSPPSAPPTTPTRAAGRCRRTGATRTSTSSAPQPDRHPVPPGRRLRRGVAALQPGSRASPSRDGPVKGDEVVLCTTGDGTTSEGEFWEALNTACNLKLPVVFLVEDNGYAISVPVEVQHRRAARSRSSLTGFPGLLIQEVDGCDSLASYDAMMQGGGVLPRPQGPGARARARDPALLPLPLRRRGALPAAGRARRRTRERDPLIRFPEHLLEQGIATEAELDADPRGGGGGGADRGRDRARVAPAGAPTRSTTTSTRPTSIPRPSSSTPRTIPASPAIRRRWWTCSTPACTTR